MRREEATENQKQKQIKMMKGKGKQRMRRGRRQRNIIRKTGGGWGRGRGALLPSLRRTFSWVGSSQLIISLKYLVWVVIKTGQGSWCNTIAMIDCFINDLFRLHSSSLCIITIMVVFLFHCHVGVMGLPRLSRMLRLRSEPMSTPIAN